MPSASTHDAPAIWTRPEAQPATTWPVWVSLGIVAFCGRDLRFLELGISVGGQHLLPCLAFSLSLGRMRGWIRPMPLQVWAVDQHLSRGSLLEANSQA